MLDVFPFRIEDSLYFYMRKYGTCVKETPFGNREKYEELRSIVIISYE